MGIMGFLQFLAWISILVFLLSSSFSAYVKEHKAVDMDELFKKFQEELGPIVVYKKSNLVWLGLENQKRWSVPRHFF